MIRINALGGLAVRDDAGNPITGAAAQPRRMAFLALLARAGQRGVTREKLLSLLWTDADDERGPRSLTQALYALRRDLGAEEAITGAKELRLDPALVSSDIAEFASAMARGDDARAVALYEGPFLDGFHLASADEFMRWVERERLALAAEFARALESLARGARAAGDASASVNWWRKLAALEPLNARVTVGLMDALTAAGDRAAALQHARVYELLVEQELDLPPDAEVLAFAERLRQTADERTATQRISDPAPPAPVATPLSENRAVAPEPRRTTRSRRSMLTGGGAIVLVAGALTLFAMRQRSSSSTSAGNASSGRVVAIGNIAAFGTDSAQASLTAPVTDLLTTSLARIHGIHVVSHGRMLELMRASAGGGASDTNAGRVVNAARQAGATEIIDGTLYARAGGHLRLDLRRIDLATGAIGDVHTVEGNDLFALVDSGTARLVAALGTAAPAGSVSDVTTHSVAAYRMYEQGIRAYYRGDVRTALQFFDAALAEDSLFALAAYYAAMSDPVPESHVTRMERARRLAVRATDRERLIITAGWAYTVSSPALGAFADTLVTRYPTEVEGYLYSGIARAFDGEFLSALTPLERVVAMDSAGLRGTRPRCAACDALQWLVGSYVAVDSLAVAERQARRWLRLQPRSEPAALAVMNVLEMEGRSSAADSIFRATATAERRYATTVAIQALHLVRSGDYAGADRILLAQLHEPDPQQQTEALWELTISLREQGRWKEALDAARRTREPMARLQRLRPARLPINVLEAQLLLEMGRPREAAVLFDSLAAQHASTYVSSERARNTAWMLTQSAGARRSAGDTGTLTRLADSIRVLGEQSGYGRDRRLHHYVRGLLLSARHDDANAINEFRSSTYSLTAGFTRINCELARLYLRDGRALDAVAVLQPALRGALDGSNLYANRTEIHELLAQAWDAAGGRDSAESHYGWVTKAWAAADASLSPRVQTAQRRLAALRKPPT